MEFTSLILHILADTEDMPHLILKMCLANTAYLLLLKMCLTNTTHSLYRMKFVAMKKEYSGGFLKLSDVITHKNTLDVVQISQSLSCKICSIVLIKFSTFLLFILPGVPEKAFHF